MPGGNIYLALRRYLSWIEGLTTNQNVTGSNPVRRTSLFVKPGRLGGPVFYVPPPGPAAPGRFVVQHISDAFPRTPLEKPAKRLSSDGFAVLRSSNIV